MELPTIINIKMSKNTADQIRETIDLLEQQLIAQPYVMLLDVSSYELTSLMKEFRSEQESYSKAGDRAQVMFYDPSEKEEFKKFIKSKNIGYDEMGGDS